MAAQQTLLRASARGRVRPVTYFGPPPVRSKGAAIRVITTTQRSARAVSPAGRMTPKETRDVAHHR